MLTCFIRTRPNWQILHVSSWLWLRIQLCRQDTSVFNVGQQKQTVIWSLIDNGMHLQLNLAFDEYLGRLRNCSRGLA